MKKNLLFLISIFLISCSNNQVISKEYLDIEINTFVDNWHSNAKNSNFDNYFNSISNDGVFIGTDATENWTKKEFITFCKPHFDKKKTWDFKTLERNIYTNENQDVIWFNELVDSWMGICRGSGVIEKIKNEYKLRQYIISVTVPNDIIKEVHHLKKEIDSSLIISKYFIK